MDYKKFFDTFDVPPSMSVFDLLASAPARRERILEHMRREAGKSDTGALLAAFKKTGEEAERHTMSGPLTHETLGQRHGKFYNIVRRFAIKQGFTRMVNRSTGT